MHPGQPATTSRPHARTAVRYKANDFSIFRERSCGTPIPIVYCNGCGTVRSEGAAAVELPLDLKPFGAGDPLTERADSSTPPARAAAGRPSARRTAGLPLYRRAGYGSQRACRPERERTLKEDPRTEGPARRGARRRLVAAATAHFMLDQRSPRRRCATSARSLPRRRRAVRGC